MKISIYRRLAMIMTFVLIVPLFWNMNIAVAQAATPTFVQTTVEIVGTGETYQLELQNKIDKSTYKWSSSNVKVATVSSKGLVTSIDKGTTTIKCKITYPSKKTKTISCKVTVSIPAEEISISNTTLVNGAHVLALGNTMDFDTQLIPANSSDKVFWSIGGGDSSCIRIDDTATGKITATKAGKVILVATAAKSSTKEAADLSIVNDAVIVEVVGPTATVKSAEITSSNVITVVFDSAVNSSTVIGQNGKLSDNIEVTMSKDTKGVLADDPGALTAVLSTDMKTLTITSSSAFNGNYGINFTSGILTTDGTALDSYYKKLYFVDTTPPAYVGTTLDDTGFIAKINFSEAIDFTDLKISGAAVVSTTGATATAASLSSLNNVMNYTISADKKSMTVNLSKISSADYGKLFSIYISGIKDLTGNAPANVYITAYLQIDNSAKPQAKVVSINRTAYNTITATFDRAIQTQTPGFMQIAGGATIYGVVDSTNTKKVNYTISDAEALYTGVKQVNIGFWNSFNVISTDTSASSMHLYYVYFTADSTSPILTAYTFDATKGILTLTYNEDVLLTSSTGVFVSTFTSLNDDIVPNTNITYTKITHTDGNNIIKLQLSGVSTIGTYTFNTDLGFVTDSFKNKSIARSIVLSTTSSTSTELPGPYSISQSSTNLNQIYVKFINKLDKTTAETVSNYSIAGLSILSATLTENASTGGTVLLTVADGSIAAEVARPVVITGVKGYNNSYTAITSYSTTITLKENAKPYYVSSNFDSTATNKNIVKLNFNEAVQGNMTVKVTQMIGTSSYEISSSVAVSGSSAVITLSTPASNGSWLRIDILTNTVTDLNGNTVSAMQSSYMVNVTY